MFSETNMRNKRQRHRDTGTRRCGEGDKVNGGDTEETQLSSVTGTQSLLTNNTQPPYNINTIGLCWVVIICVTTKILILLTVVSKK